MISPSSAPLTVDQLIPTSDNSGQAGIWLPKKYTKSQAVPTSIVSTFQSGHGWSGLTGITVSADTTDFVVGSQCLSAAVSTTSVTYLQSPSAMGLNATGKMFELLIKVTNGAKLATAAQQFRVTTDGTNYASATFISQDTGRDEWQRIVIPQSAFTGVVAAGVDWSNIARIRIALNTLSGQTVTVKLNRLALLDPPSAGPVVSFTFDDAYQDAYTTYLRKLAAYGYPGTCYLIAANLDTAGKLTTAQAQELQNSHGWQMSCHALSQSIHDNADWTDYDAMERSFLKLKHLLAAKGFNGIDDFAYGPYTNRKDTTTRDLVKKYFRSSRLAGQIIHEQPRPLTLDYMSSYTWTTQGTAAVQTALDAAVAAKGWLILTFHNVAATSSQNAISVADFATIVDAVHTAGAKVMTVGDVLATL